MQKKILVGSITVVALLILVSFSSAVGHQTVEISNTNIDIIDNNQKELFFNTILDIANNREIINIIFNSQNGNKRFLNHDLKTSITTPNLLTKKDINLVYLIGLRLSKNLQESTINSITEQYKESYKEIQKEITTVIEKDTILKDKISKLSNAPCDCEDDSEMIQIDDAGICVFAFILFWGAGCLMLIPGYFAILFTAISQLSNVFLFIVGAFFSLYFYALTAPLLALFLLSLHLLEKYRCLPGGPW